MAKDGETLKIHYRHNLETLGKSGVMLGVIFRKAQNKIQDPAKLRRPIADLIDRERWRDLDSCDGREHCHGYRSVAFWE
jgi:type I restriction enzyme M protein